MSKLNIRCYDNGGESYDRYTIVNIDDLERITPDGAIYSALSASEEPFNALGVGQHTSAMIGEHLGKEISFDELPEDVQLLVVQNFS
jgi:hypothetical protein